MNGTRDHFLSTSVPQGGAATPQRTPELYDEDEETMITLLLVDDEPLVRQGLHTWLEQVGEIRVIGEASNGAEAIALAQALHPDVVLVDISMPTTDGIAATAALRASVPHCAVVPLSLYDDATMRARAHAAGAVTLVGKQEGVRALLTAIHEAGGKGRVSAQE
jgi:DNA-binding NarL/FixJ family response regulator